MYLWTPSRFWAKPSIVKSNIFAYPCSEKLKISWICLEDVAAFMVAALSDKEIKAEKITIGGPEILCGHEVAEIFSKALKRQITFQSLEPNTFARKMSKIVTGSEEYENHLFMEVWLLFTGGIMNKIHLHSQ